MPTFHVCLTAPVAGSSAATVFCPLIAAYRVEPSGEYLVWPTRAEWPLTAGIGTLVGVPSVPSGLTGKRARPFCSGSHRSLPSGEYVGPSWPTVPSVSRRLTPEALPTVQMSRKVDRSKICRTTDLSALVAATKRPFGLTVDPMS